MTRPVGRPRKATELREYRVWCCLTASEMAELAVRAGSLRPSEYLRELALRGTVAPDTTTEVADG